MLHIVYYLCIKQTIFLKHNTQEFYRLFSSTTHKKKNTQTINHLENDFRNQKIMILTYLEHRSLIINIYTEPLKEFLLTCNVYKRRSETLTVQYILTFHGGALYERIIHLWNTRFCTQLRLCSRIIDVKSQSMNVSATASVSKTLNATFVMFVYIIFKHHIPSRLYSPKS